MAGLRFGTGLSTSSEARVLTRLKKHIRTLDVECAIALARRMGGTVGHRSARRSRTVLLHFHREWATRQHGGEKPLMRVAA